MRRGRILATAVVVVVMLATAAAGVAATPHRLFSHNAIQQGYGGVGGQSTTPRLHQVAGAQKTVQNVAAAPATHATGTLPFTGAQLGIFVLIGFALIGGGLLVRRAGAGRAEG